MEKRRIGLAAMVLVSGCVGTAGSGKPTIESRKLEGPFDRVELRGAFVADIRVGMHARHAKLEPGGSVTLEPGGSGVVVSGDDNLVDHLHTRVDHGVLIAETVGRIRPREPLTLSVYADKLDAISSSGAVDVKLEALPTPPIDWTTTAMKIDVRGASHLVASGAIGSLSLDAEGAAAIDATSVAVNKAVVHASGAVHARLNANASLEAHLSGACSVEYGNHPSRVIRDVSGASVLVEKDPIR
jgi:hypothetical protein